MAHSEILGDERNETAPAFWRQANTFFDSHGIVVKRVLTDNGTRYRSKLFKETLGKNIAHKKTRPYRSQTNGKVERFNRTLAAEWAYFQTYLSEHHHNCHRPHTGIGGKTPIERLRVHNLPAKNN